MNQEHYTLGLRWSYPTNKQVEQFIITTEYNNTNVCTDKFAPKLCSAWPNYYCQAISYLNNSENFTIKVFIK